MAGLRILLCFVSSVAIGAVGSLVANRIERFLQRRAKEKSSNPDK